MGAAVGEPDRPGRALQMRRFCRVLQLLRPLPELLRLDDEQVAAGIDADIVELRRLLAQLLRHLHVALVAPGFGSVGLVKCGACPGIGQGEDRRLLRPQEQRPVGRRIEEGAVVAGQDNRHVARQRIQPALQLRDLFKVEMVGRLVEQKHVGLAHPGAGKHGKPLPAAAQLLQRLRLRMSSGTSSDSSTTSTRQLSLSA